MNKRYLNLPRDTEIGLAVFALSVVGTLVVVLAMA